MSAETTIGCIGLGVMGEPICANLLRKSGCPVAGLRSAPGATRAPGRQGASRPGTRPRTSRGMPPCCSCPCRAGRSLPTIGARLLGVMRPRLGAGRPLDGTRRSHPRARRKFAARGMAYADAPVARTRFAAERGELCVMVGADAATFARIEPYLRCFASDILHCGGIGCGQVAKLMNNMVLFEIGGAIAEALAIGRESGVEPAVLLEALCQRLGRQLCAAQPRPKGHVAEKLSRAGILDPVCAEGPGIRARAGRPGRHRRPRRPLGPRAFSREHRRRRRRALLARDRRAYRRRITKCFPATGAWRRRRRRAVFSELFLQRFVAP